MLVQFFLRHGVYVVEMAIYIVFVDTPCAAVLII